MPLLKSILGPSLLIFVSIVGFPFLGNYVHNYFEYQKVSYPLKETKQDNLNSVIRFEFGDGSWMQIARISKRIHHYQRKDVVVAYFSDSTWFEGPSEFEMKERYYRFWIKQLNSKSFDKNEIIEFIEQKYIEIKYLDECETLLCAKKILKIEGFYKI